MCVDNVAQSITFVDPANNAASVQKDKTVVIIVQRTDEHPVGGECAFNPRGVVHNALGRQQQTFEIKGNPGWIYNRGESTAESRQNHLHRAQPGGQRSVR